VPFPDTETAWSAHHPRAWNLQARRVPRISSFHGIVIAMYYKEHGRPHFHARFAEHDASIAIDNLEILQGALPPRSLTLVREWARLHRDALEVNWARARSGWPLLSIEPLP
jgi:Domain of unknown function (DUF4160)